MSKKIIQSIHKMNGQFGFPCSRSAEITVHYLKYFCVSADPKMGLPTTVAQPPTKVDRHRAWNSHTTCSITFNFSAQSNGVEEQIRLFVQRFFWGFSNSVMTTALNSQGCVYFIYKHINWFRRPEWVHLYYSPVLHRTDNAVQLTRCFHSNVHDCGRNGAIPGACWERKPCEMFYENRKLNFSLLLQNSIQNLDWWSEKNQSSARHCAKNNQQEKTVLVNMTWSSLRQISQFQWYAQVDLIQECLCQVVKLVNV